ncbi:hypothetical protein ASB7_16800 (plasmid) [Helicobacter ailurogastricus]|nr:hypothetical protein ASB7_16800 [Helicobacter ailurogastricus]
MQWYRMACLVEWIATIYIGLEARVAFEMRFWVVGWDRFNRAVIFSLTLG